MLIQRFKSTIIKYQLCQLLVIAFLFYSCSKDNVKREPEPGKAAVKVTDSDYFKAVFFLDGPLVKNLGDYQALSVSRMVDDDKALKEIRATENKVLEYIESSSAGFFVDFKAKVTSGDYSQVSAAMKEGARQYLEAIVHLNGQKKLDDELGKAVVQEFTKKYGSLESVSKTDLARNIRHFAKEANSIVAPAADSSESYYQVTSTVHTQTASLLYYYAAAAVLIIIVIVLGYTPNEQLLNDDLTKTNGFGFDDYSSMITIGFAGK
ncbi:hypothetical protein [Chitinophaga solisilvae]|uniref:hypothetical protein n=1 Tax=Chitinophaga solisilvae TaxID=1233460 RepID=UPI00136DD5F5|nr:hypothetical protein [Chitinophaga solisilvae]